MENVKPDYSSLNPDLQEKLLSQPTSYKKNPQTKPIASQSEADPFGFCSDSDDEEQPPKKTV